MNKLWLAVLLVPYLGVSPIPLLSELSLLFEEEVILSHNDQEEVKDKQECASRNSLEEYSEGSSVCAHCGSMLLANPNKKQSLATNNGQEENSQEIVSSDKSEQVKPDATSLKNRSSSPSKEGSTSRRSKQRVHSNRPQVTQRKERSVQNQAELAESIAIDTPSEQELDPSQHKSSKPNPQSANKSSQQNKKKSERIKIQANRQSKKSVKEATAGERPTSPNLADELIEEGDSSEIGQGKGVILDKPPSGRFAKRDEKKSRKNLSLEGQKTMRSTGSKQQKTITKRPMTQTKAQLKESMSSRPGQAN